MVGKKTLKDYGFKTMQEYYDMIEESKLNGQLTQAGEQFKALAKDQRKDFLSYLADQTKAGEKWAYELLKLLIEHT